MLLKLPDRGGATVSLMVNVTDLRRHRTTSSLGLKREGVAA